MKLVKHKLRLNRKGFTLAEAIMAMVILGFAASGILLPFSYGAKVQAEGVHRTLAAKLATDAMEVILQSPFDDIISTYNGLTETQGQIKSVTGSVFTDPSYNNFSRSISCEYIYTSQESGTYDPRLIRATVTVYYNGTELVSVSRLISK